MQPSHPGPQTGPTEPLSPVRRHPAHFWLSDPTRSVPITIFEGNDILAFFSQGAHSNFPSVIRPVSMIRLFPAVGRPLENSQQEPGVSARQIHPTTGDGSLPRAQNLHFLTEI